MISGCDILPHELNMYLDHELPWDREQAVETHLKSCRRCRKRLSEIERVTHALLEAYDQQQLTTPDSALVWRRIHAQRSNKAASQPRLLQWLMQPRCYLTAVAAALALFLMFMPQKNNPVIKPGRIQSITIQPGTVMVLKTAKTGQPLIWIVPKTEKGTG